MPSLAEKHARRLWHDIAACGCPKPDEEFGGLWCPACMDRKQIADLLGELADLRGDRDKRIALGMRLGQILGPAYDGVSMDEIARELVVLRAERDTLQQHVEDFTSGLREEMATVGMDLLAGAWEARAKQAEADLAALRGAHHALREALVVARDALAAFGKEAAYLPAQQGYSATLTESEMKLARAVADLDRILEAHA